MKDEDLKYLAAYDLDMDDLVSEPDFPECSEPPPAATNEAWWPDLYPTQMKVFNDYSKHILVYGERGSGKGIVSLHKCVRHAWENWEALVMVSSLTLTSATAGGVWSDLVDFVLPQWEEGVGLKWVGPRQDQAKNSYVKVANRYGGWSTIMLKPIPSGSVISQRFKGTAPSMIFFDEITETDDPRYFRQIVQQLGRRRGIKHQQFIAACNPSPKGEDHWVYQQFIKEPEDEVERKDWKQDYAAYHIPFSENINMENREEYLRTLESVSRHDPTERARIIEGKWVKQQLGEGIF